ncbi:restriction endonuclease subunit S domain-containing protein [Lutispora saccharofermentans]|uniref:Uncharacterized protein n=1 Tax=Lutispora saccharofermentans TaxID=3024236 RepID=A0ABT1NES3_9FIRM|nr:hypothetical protein [Lutispora saccharofermentans]MCQ1529569.1 hypothetical protein [Lutispora saccharofermentans]
MKEPDIDGATIRKNKIPILIYTPEWIQLFSNFKSRSMQKSIAKLEELLAKEKNLEQELKELEKRKKISMNKILHLSNELNENNNEAFLGPLKESQKEILHINQRIPLILEELEALPSAIDQENAILLKETVKRTYELINESKQEADEMQQDISRIREALMELIQKKVDMDERVNRLYSYLHGIVGVDEMDKLDESLLKA